MISARRGKAIGLLDVPWLAMETRRHPMHVAGLIICRLPADAGPTFVRDLADDLRRFTKGSAPFDRRPELRGHVWPRWIPVPDLQLAHHVRHHVLPRPGSVHELEELVSGLHQTPLDLTRPLWEYHLVEGLDDNRFAIYAKFHHSIADGVAAIRILQAAFTTDPSRRDMPPVWAYTPAGRNSGGRHHRLRAVRVLGRVLQSRLSRTTERPATRPYGAPRSRLNTKIGPARSVGLLRIEIDRLRALAAGTGGTVNDALLMVCSTGLRDYLGELDALPAAPLVATVPMSVRTADHDEAGNAITFLFVSLASEVADPQQRAARIVASSADAKEKFATLPKEEIDTGTVLTMAPFFLTQLLGLGARVRPMFNVAISNIPGSREPLFHNGIRVLSVHPVSVLQSGQALNITALSYVGHLNVTVTADPGALPHVRRLTDHFTAALEHLEAHLTDLPLPTPVEPGS